MTITKKEYEDFSSLFAGHSKAHGITEFLQGTSKNGKKNSKSWTAKKALSPAQWKAHLAGIGSRGYGQYPILDDGENVNWGCIDIDSYESFDHAGLEKSIQGTPLVITVSKSGGAHVWLFLSKPAAAAKVRALLSDWNVMLGLEKANEIFPKQDRIKEGEFGNWINLPYLGDSRKCFLDGHEVDLAEFIPWALEQRTTLEEISEFADGPPCFTKVIWKGIEKNYNDFMLNIGAYYKRKFPDDWRAKLFEFNKKNTAPMNAPDIQKLAGSVEKGYPYRCLQPPLCNECNDDIKTICRHRLYGIGGKEGRAKAPINPDIASQLNDDGNAIRFSKQSAGKIKYDHLEKRYYLFKGHRFAPDICEAVFNQARATIESLSDLTKGADKKTIATVERHKNRSRERMPAMLRLAQTLPTIRLEYSSTVDNVWNQSPGLIAVGNGVLDVINGTLRDGKPDDLINIGTAVNYVPGAKAPRWLQFLEEIYSGDVELIRWVQLLAGYTLSGQDKYELIPFHNGAGSNGKSTLFNALGRVFGDLHGVIGFEELLTSNSDRIKDGVASIKDKLFVTASEPRSNRVLSNAAIKKLAGRELIRAEKKFQASFEYRPRFMVWVACNVLPDIDDITAGTWRRLPVIPYEASFEPTVGVNLDDELAAESEGILAWIVAGAQRLKNENLLNFPPAVIAATKKYQKEANQVECVIEACCIESPDGLIKFSAFRYLFDQFLEKQGVPPWKRLSTRAIGQYLKTRLTPIKIHGVRYYKGIEEKGEDTF